MIAVVFPTSPIFYGVLPLLPFPLLWMLVVGFLLFSFVFGYCFRYWPGDNVKIKPIRASAFQHEYFINNSISDEKGGRSRQKKTKQKKERNNYYDTIVIGSGSGGCACANLLSQSGQKVLVLEQHVDRTGGCTHTFRDNNCEWDTGLHVSFFKMHFSFANNCSRTWLQFRQGINLWIIG